MFFISVLGSRNQCCVMGAYLQDSHLMAVLVTSYKHGVILLMFETRQCKPCDHWRNKYHKPVSLKKIKTHGKVRKTDLLEKVSHHYFKTLW